LNNDIAVTVAYQRDSTAHSYVDAGVTAIDDLDGNITANTCVVTPMVTVPGSGNRRAAVVDAVLVNSPLGTEYHLDFMSHDRAGNKATVTRVVTVVDDIPPVMSLVGTNPVTLPLGIAYTEPGVGVIDNHDDNPTVVYPTTGVLVEQPGDYPQDYASTDAAGNTALPLSRTVRIEAFSEPPPSYHVSWVLNASLMTAYPAITQAVRTHLRVGSAQPYLFTFAEANATWDAPDQPATLLIVSARATTAPYDWLSLPFTTFELLEAAIQANFSHAGLPTIRLYHWPGDPNSPVHGGSSNSAFFSSSAFFTSSAFFSSTPLAVVIGSLGGLVLRCVSLFAYVKLRTSPKRPSLIDHESSVVLHPATGINCLS
jgi:hypothetical protein